MEDYSLKEDILEQIQFMKTNSFEELYRIVLSAISLYVRSVVLFGFNSRQAKENISIVNEMRKILKEEKVLLSLIEENIDNVDLDDACDVVDTLDALNDRTYLAYDSIFSEIETSCEIRNKDRVLRPRTPIDSLITNDEYKTKVQKLIKRKTIE